MRSRRGVALLAALWLVVAIAAVALQFSLEAHERRQLGIDASERGIQRGLALGALAATQARLEQALRVAPSGSNAIIAGFRTIDPWLDADSIYSGEVDVDSVPVTVRAVDLGEKLNINNLNENEIQTFFSFLLHDYSKSAQLAQSIMDWRDPDSIPRPNGAERDAYVRAGMLALPTNAPFREITELRNVMGMTPEIYEEAVPYLTTHGDALVNLNTAPVPVLRVLPGMTDATINLILQLRSQGRRIQSVAQVLPGAGDSRRRIAGQLATPQALNALRARATTQTTWVELTILARAGPQSAPTKLVAVVRQNADRTTYVDSMIW